MTALIGLDRKLTDATPEQRAVFDKIADGPRGSVPSPFYAMLDCPALADSIQEVGATIRFSSTLPAKLREHAILATAGAVECGYEWNYHMPIAKAAGLGLEAIKATLPDMAAGDVDEPEGILTAFCRDLALRRDTEQARLAHVVALFGRSGATELVAIVGYYALLATFIKIGGFDEPFSFPDGGAG